MFDNLQSEKIANDARNLNNRLQKALELTRLFNSRELLFGSSSTDYSKLKKIIDQFTPFFYLWDTADSWNSSYQTWMNDSFDGLNANEIDENVTSWWKGLFKTFREFQKREIFSQCELCEFIRKEVENVIYFT